MISMALVSESMGAELSSGLLWIVIFLFYDCLSKTLYEEERELILLQNFSSANCNLFREIDFQCTLSLFIISFPLLCSISNWE